MLWVTRWAWPIFHENLLGFGIDFLISSCYLGSLKLGLNGKDLAELIDRKDQEKIEKDKKRYNQKL